MSVSTSVCMKLPLATGPLCATRSASKNPGGGYLPIRESAHRNAAPDSGRRRRAAVRPARPLVSEPRAGPGPSSPRSSPAGRRTPPARAADAHAAPWPRPASAAVVAAASVDPVRRLPDHDQRRADRLVVNPSFWARARALATLAAAEQTHRMLTMKAGHRDELVENAALFLKPRSPIPLPQPSGPVRHASTC